VYWTGVCVARITTSKSGPLLTWTWNLATKHSKGHGDDSPKFDLSLDDPNYQLEIVESLTLKPNSLKVHARLRNGITPSELLRSLVLGDSVPGPKTARANNFTRRM
jgi:hypothetical protein